MKWSSILFRLLLVGAFVLYGISLALPGYTALNSGTLIEAPPGIEILALGWLGIFGGVFAWYGNLFYLFAAVMSATKNYRAGLISAIIGFFIGLSAFLTTSWTESESGNPIPNTHVIHFDAGYYLWLASFVCLIAYFAIRRGSIIE